MHTPAAPRRLKRLAASALAFGVGSATLVTGFAGPAANASTSPAAASAAVVSAAELVQPRLVFRETFEHGVDDTATSLSDYTSETGGRYTADAFWLDMGKCNGIVLSAEAATSAQCGPLRTLASTLGTIGGAPDPRLNHAVSAYTAGNTAPNEVQLRTVDPLSLGSGERFISFGVDAVATSCHVAHPLLNFFFDDDGVEVPISTEPIDPCVSPGENIYESGRTRGGTFVSDGGILFSGTEFGVIMRNAEGSGIGNDGAVDNLAVYDSTPTLATSVSGGDGVAGAPVTVSFTVTNTADLGKKQGWAFEQLLPDGLAIVAGSEETSCASTTVTTDDGRIMATGELRTGDAECMITVQLVSLTGGAFEIGGAAVSGVVGLDIDPTASTISFADERNTLEIAASGVIEIGNGDGYADLGETVTFVYQVVNAGNAPVGGMSVDGASCATTTLAAGASTECRSAPITVTQADLDRGSIDATGSATGVSRLGTTVVSAAVDPSVATTPAAAAVGLQLTASPVDDAAPAVGDRIALSVEWTNAGNVSIAGLSASIPALPELVADCTSGSLAPGESAVCELTGNYRVTQEDVDRGSILFAATGAARAGGAELTAPIAIASVTTEAAAPSVQLGAALLITDSEAVPGMPATITSTITNPGNVTLSVITVAVDGRPELAIACPSGPLAPGETVECESTIARLTQADIDRGSLSFTIVANGVSPSGAPVTDPKTVSVDIAQWADVSVVTSAESDSSDVPAVGDAITEHVTITNAGNVTLTEVSLGGAVCVAALAPGEAVSCSADGVLLTQDAIDAGSIDLSAAVRAGSSAGAVETDTETSHLIDGIGGIEIVDAVEIAPAGDGSVTVGETVRMSYLVTNTGNVTLDALEVQGEHDGHARCEVVAGDAAGWSFWSSDDISLAPGGAALCLMPDHRVDDVSEAMLTFSATVTGTAPREVRIGNDSPEGDELSAKAVEMSTEVTASITTTIDTRPAPVAPPLAATGAAAMAVAPFAVGLFAVGGLLLLARRRSIAQD